MQSDTVTRETWREAVREQRLTLPALARLTNTNLRMVRAYAYGGVKAPDAWVADVATVLEVMRAFARNRESA